MYVTRLRQAVVAAADRDAFRRGFDEHFGVGEPYADPGVSGFGLHNYVFAIGDTFVEVVSPTREGTTAGRFLQRNGGDCGYMVIFQVEDIEACRQHLQNVGVRTIWSHDSADIGSVHIHPQDIGGAIVSFDEPRPASSWLWGGPDWSHRSKTQSVTGLAGVTLSASNPHAVAATWSRVLHAPVSSSDDGLVIALPDGCELRFDGDAQRAAPVLAAISLRAAAAPIGSVTIAGTAFCAVA